MTSGNFRPPHTCTSLPPRVCFLCRFYSEERTQKIPSGVMTRAPTLPRVITLLVPCKVFTLFAFLYIYSPPRPSLLFLHDLPLNILIFQLIFWSGFFFIFFGLALAAWCAIIAFTMFYCIVIRNSKVIYSLPCKSQNNQKK